MDGTPLCPWEVSTRQTCQLLEGQRTSSDGTADSAFTRPARVVEGFPQNIVDAETYTAHMARYGTQPWPRVRFLKALEATLKKPTRQGPWTLDADLPLAT